jgi:Zn-dependent protease
MFSLEAIIYFLPGVIIGLTVHEYAHATVALRLGDDTARSMGRTSLNPLVHIDLFGFLFLVLLGFGWAKPVMIDPTKLRYPRRDDALIAAAGPISNLLVAITGAATLAVIMSLIPYRGQELYGWIIRLIIAGIQVNLGLFVFNAIPLPPLDGSHVFMSALNLRNTPHAGTFVKYGALLLFGIIIAEQVTRVDILPIGKAVRWLTEGLLKIFGFPK